MLIATGKVQYGLVSEKGRVCRYWFACTGQVLCYSDLWPVLDHYNDSNHLHGGTIAGVAAAAVAGPVAFFV